MPSYIGTEFGVIDQYLSLKEQIDSEDDSSSSAASDKKAPLPVAYWMEPADSQVEDHHHPMSTLFTGLDRHAPTVGGGGGGGGDYWGWPSNFLLTGSNDPPKPILAVSSSSSSPSSPGHTTTPTPTTTTTTTYVAGFGGSGGTVIEASSPGDGVPFPPEDQESDLLDLDGEKHTSSFYEKEGCCYLRTFKTEDGLQHPGLEEDFKTSSLMGMDPPEDVLMMPFREDREDITSFMINTLKDDIMMECKELNISSNPEEWSAQDTVKWVSSVLKKSQQPSGPLTSCCPDPDLVVFNLPGHLLCSMPVEEFRRCSPYGEFVHQRLELWRIAMDMISDHHDPTTTPPHSSSTYTSQHHHHHHHNPHPHPNHHHPSPHTPSYPHHPSPHHPYPHHHHHPTTTTTTTTIPGHPMVSDYGRGGSTPHMPLSISPAPSSDSLCSSSSSSSSLSSSLGKRGRGVAPPQSAVFDMSHHDHYEDDFFGGAPRRKPTQPMAAHPTPPHLPTPPRGARAGKQTIHLWQFLRELLDNAESYHDCIKWTDRTRGIFKIEDSSKVARLWGRRKNRPAMNYDKLSRSVRQYYKKGIIRKTEHSKRLVYQFCPPYL